MATHQVHTILQHLRKAALLRDVAELTDAQLLKTFVAQGEEAAFEALLRRHGPMVLGVCYRILRNHHDAEDAFQATFLVFARKASSVLPADRVACWLHGVAQRTALKARTMKAKHQRRKRNLASTPEPGAVCDLPEDLRPLIDEELARLPEIYRLAVLTCDVEGKSIKAATQQLGWPQGTLASRLVRGRRMLAKRLTQRGVTLSAGALATLLTSTAASASVSPGLTTATVTAATAFASGNAMAVSSNVIALTEGVLTNMMLAKWKTSITAIILVAMLAIGMSAPLGGQPQAPPPRAERSAKAPAIRATAKDGKSAAKDAAAKKEAARVVYAVADLVVPIPGLDVPANAKKEERKTKEAWLIAKIVRTVAPESWEDAGGTGTIQYFPHGMSLVVNNTPRVQAQVNQLLETLRRVQDVQVVAETRVVSVEAATFLKLQKLLPELKKDGQTILNDAEVFALVRKAQEDKGTKVEQAPKITFFPGQRVALATDAAEKVEVKLSALVASNLHHIELDVKAKVGKIDFAGTTRMVDGMTLAQVKRTGEGYMVLLVTPTVIVNVDEQVEATPPNTKNESTAPPPKALKR